LKRLATLPEEDKQACVDAYKFFQRMQAGEETSTEDETRAVADYYRVLNNMLSVFDLEKLYIPPQLDDSQGLYGNQLLCEQAVLKELALEKPDKSHLLDMGCGRGRISHYLATLTGGQVSGYNIDPNQIENAIDWAAETGMSDRLHFKVGNHHEPLEYESEFFDGCFSFQAVWPFFKKEELDEHAREMYRVLKPGTRYACSEYLLSPYFDWNNEEHVALHKNAGRHAVDVSGRRLFRFGKSRLPDPRFGAFEERSLAALRAEARSDPDGAKGSPSPRGDSRLASVGRGIARSSSNGWPSLDGCREGQDRRSELENRRGETVTRRVSVC
jgi:ubiquinone/menaquinone biosynthesis C-methylase UbiE